MRYVSLADALAEMSGIDGFNRAVPFSIEFVEADRRRKAAGKIKVIPRAVMYRKQNHGTEHSPAATGFKKKPNHWLNHTRNIVDQHTREMKKIHLRLVTKVNEQLVHW